MSHPWVAIDSTTDPLTHARQLARARDQVLGGGPRPGVVRDVIADSWRRCETAGVDAETRLAPVLLDEAQLRERRERHPLAAVLPMLRSLLGDVAVDARHVLVVSDAEGHLLWVEGHPMVLRAAESMHFVSGALWSEKGAGTNAIGTTLAVDHPVQIFSAEHYHRAVLPWTCAGAPIHDPTTGELLGAVDVTGGLKTAHPHSLTLVSAAARMAEDRLRTLAAGRDERLRERLTGRMSRATGPCAIVAPGGRVVQSTPEGWLGREVTLPPAGGVVALADGRRVIAEPADGDRGQLVWLTRRGDPAFGGERAVLRIDALGRERAEAQLGAERVPLSPRHSEILVALALHPEGLTGLQLASAVYDGGASPVTIRAEMTRLRRILGGWLAARPYRLLADVRADFLDADPATLLPGSQAPIVRAARLGRAA